MSAVPPIKRVAVISSASGNEKTTVVRQLAGRLGVPFVELDALVHGPALPRRTAAHACGVTAFLSAAGAP